MKTMTLQFRDPARFHSEAVAMTVTGAMAGLAAHVAGLAWPSLAPLASPVPLLAVAVAVVLAATAAPRRWRPGTLVGLAGCTAVAAIALGWAAVWPGALVFAGAFAVFLSRDARGPRLAAVVAGAAASVLAAWFVLARFSTADALAQLPGWLVAGVAGAGFGTVCAVAAFFCRLEIHRDRVALARARIPAEAGGELGALLDRAVAVWRRVEDSVDRDHPGREATETAVLRLLVAAAGWHALNAQAHGDESARAEILAARLEDLDGRIAAASDATTAAAYTHARAAIADQLRHVRDIATRHERVIARAHGYVAGLESLRLAMLAHDTANASRAAGELEPLWADIEHLGEHLDLSGQAMAEIDAPAMATA
ncbi:MAG TPA: hypothetical protein VFG83_15835, partial [Kofleriaceae bacterium]|nr:hypothetical protein [Kofleriaceae bacterium]